MESDSNQESLLKREWKIFFTILFKPLVICPTIITIIFLVFANADSSAERKFSILLNILAAIALAFAGGFLTDTYKSLIGDQILIKKGLSAVRNLSLCRWKINTISKALIKGSAQEAGNLLDMLEKDIANATQEWNDIIPGVTENIEATYVVLKEKEEELKITHDELERIKKESLSSVEQEKNTQELNKKISTLTEQISKLQIQTSSPVGSSVSAATALSGVAALELELNASGRNQQYPQGAVVRHRKFGLGTVQSVQGAGDDLMVIVNFPGHGDKKLVVKNAGLELL
jgi:hypothetical protein